MPLRLDRRMILAAGVAGLAAGPAHAFKLFKRKDESRPEPVTLSYGGSALDVYSPPGAAGLPVMFFVHGGAWYIGTRERVRFKEDFFLQNGFVFVSVDYRLLPKVDVATQANDIEAAYDFVRAHIATFGGDPDRIVAMGHSAGAHLVALTGLRGSLPGVRGLVLNDIGAYDLPAMADEDGELPPVYKQAFPDPAQWATLSPITYVGTHPHPPVFISWTRLPFHRKESLRLATKLMQNGTAVSVFDGRGYDHFRINRHFGLDGDPMTQAVIEYFLSL